VSFNIKLDTQQVSGHFG